MDLHSQRRRANKLFFTTYQQSGRDIYGGNIMAAITSAQIQLRGKWHQQTESAQSIPEYYYRNQQ